MRICLLTGSFLPGIGGLEWFIHHLANSLSCMNNKVYVLAPHRDRRVTDLKNIEINYKLIHYPFFPKGGKYMHEPFILHLIIRRYQLKFDVLHAHFAYSAGYNAVRIKKYLRIPVVITAHAADVQKLPEMNYGCRLDSEIEQKVNFALKNTDAIISISRSVKEDVIDAGGEEEKIFDIPLGINIKQFNTKRPDLRKILGLSDRHRVILTVGRNHPKKCFSDLIRAVSLVKPKIPNLKCIIVGRDTETLMPLIRHLNVKDSIILTGEIRDQDLLPFYYQTSEIFVSSSLIEGLPLVMLEAVSAGLPIVATNVPGNKDIVQDNRNGFLIPPQNQNMLADRIITLLKDESLRKKMGSKSLEIAQNYDIRLVAKKHLQVYKKVIGNSIFT